MSNESNKANVPKETPAKSVTKTSSNINNMKNLSDEKKLKEKKVNMIILGVLAVLVLSIGIGIFYFSTDGENSGYFVAEYQTACENILSDLLDATVNYPKTPEEVTKAYLYGSELLFTGKLANYDVVPIVIDAQRNFTSDELNNYNPVAIQNENIINLIQTLEKDNSKFINIETSPAIYDQKDNNLAYVRVTQNDNKFVRYYQLFHLQKSSDEDVWKIIAWYNTNEDFNRID